MSYRSSPYASPQPLGGSQLPVQPGQITYTTSTDAQGRLVYNQFRAEPASYQTANGVVHGIQWVPAESTMILPQGAQLAGPDFHASWNRNYANQDKALKGWQHEEEKRRKKEEKESSKRVSAWEKEKREREKAEEKEMRRARDNDHRRERRLSNVGYDQAGLPSYDREPKYGVGAGELDRQFGDMNIGGGGGPGGYGGRSPYEPPRADYSQPGPPNAYGGRTSPMPGGYPGADGRRSPMPSGYPGADGRRSPMPGGYPTGRVSPMPGGGPGGPGYPTGRVSPMPGGPGYPTGRVSPMPGGPGYPTGRVSPMPGGGPPLQGGPGYPMGRVSPRPVYPNTGRVSPMPTGFSPAGNVPGPYSSGRISPRPGGGPQYGPPPVSPRPGGGRTSPLPPTASPYGGGPGTLPSGGPYGGGSGPLPSSGPYGRSTSPAPPRFAPYGVYPKGHIAEGQPMPAPPGSQPIGRNHSPIPTYPGGGQQGFSRSPRIGGGGMPLSPDPLGSGGLATPESFDRPINKALSFTTFDRFKVQDLEEFYDRPPVRLPKILTTHDIFNPDWDRFMGDIGAAWMGRLPVPNQTGKTPKPSSLVADLVELWNQSFFQPRGIELELYRGRELRTGRNAGRSEFRLPRVEAYDSESSDVSDDESESDREGQGAGLYGGVYGRPDRYNPEAEQERRYRREQKAEKRRRAQERKQRKKEEEKRYKLYVSATAPRGARGY